jgi:hypothetical protein
MNPRNAKLESIEFGLDLYKSDSEEGRYIQGIASTEEKDLQAETVIQKGIDYSYLIKRGYLNSEHRPGPKYIVGEPTSINITPKGMFIKGFLYKGKQEADDWWELIKALDLNKSSRSIGMSIQGKVLRKFDNQILKCWLTAIAITSNPVNPNTYVEIVKSLDPSGTEEELKALTTVTGAALMPEDLDSDERNTTMAKGLNFSQAIEYLKLEEGYSYPAAKAIAKAIFYRYGIVA